jgi:SAM-dependent methyltransferase
VSDGHRIDYLQQTYSSERLPLSNYPNQLGAWLLQNIIRIPGRLLDVGCGRGEYLRAFSALGCTVVGVDSAPSAREMSPDFRIELADVETEALPFDANTFDVVFSKSVIEHLHRPDAFLSELIRVLKPGGLLIAMTPSWRHQRRVFFEDYTHVSPFTVNGLTDALIVNGLETVNVRLFWQLPLLWKYPLLMPLVKATSMVPVSYRPWDPAPWPEQLNKWIRFSKEAMLLGTGCKPKSSGRN